ncbi:MAG: AI-2E family transporter [Saccharofermentanales bacterium]
MDHDNENLNDDKRTILSIIKYALIAAILVAVVYLGIKILWLLLPVLIGFIIAYTSVVISSSLYRLVRRKKPRSLAQGGDTKGYRVFKLVIFSLILLTFLGFIILVIFALISQIRNLVSFIENNTPSAGYIQNISDYLRNISEQLGGILPQAAIERLTEELSKLQDDLFDLIPAFTSALLGSLLSFVSNFPDILFKIIVVLMAGYYFISDRIVIGKFMNMLFPSQPFVTKVVGAITKVSSSFFRVIGGYMIIMTVTFIEALIGLTIIQMPYAVILAIAVMFIDLLPLVGASACFVPISIYMFAQGKPVYGIIALSMVGVMSFMRSIMEPRIIGTAMKLHPLATLVAMLLGVSAFGFIGFLGGPMLVVFAIGLSDAFGFQNTFREWSGKLLNKVARVNKDGTPDTTIPSEPESYRKIRHIVMWRLNDTAHGMAKEEIITIMTEKLNALPASIPQILYFKVGSDIRYDSGAYDLVLVVDFATVEDLDIYKNHPKHVLVAKWIKKAIKERSVVDFEIDS